MSKKFLVSYSGGKDSTLALYRMIQQGHTPVGLLITINKLTQTSWFHVIPRFILQEISNALNIPVFFIESLGSENYLQTYEDTMKKVKDQTDADSCIFGDIDIEDHRIWCTERTHNVGIEALFPLWQEDREQLTYEFIDAGFETMIKVVDTNFLSSDILGCILTKELVETIKKTGADPCGENGEYHTVTFNGPIFSKKIDLIKGTITGYEKYNILEIKI